MYMIMTKHSIINSGKTLTLALTALVAMAACSQDEGAPQQDPSRAITFNVTTLGAQTVTTRAELTEQLSSEFGLMAYRHSHDEWTGNDELPNFMYRVKATKPEGAAAWSTATQYYWPFTAEHMRFFAYAPFSIIDDKMSANTQTGAPQIKEYAVAADPIDQQDLMFAWSDDMLCSNGGAVALPFRHIMTAIRFAVPDSETGTVNNIQLVDIPCTGTYTAMGSWGTPHTPATYTGQLGTTFILMPQTLPASAKLVVNYKKDATSLAKDLVFSLAGKEWQQGRIYTYTINIVNSELQPEISNWEAVSDETLAVDY